MLFVSDTHLGYENRLVTGRGKTVSWAREISSEQTIRRISEIALGRDVDAVIHTGDVLDHEVDEGTLATAAFRFRLLAASGIPAYFIIGSHDHESYQPRHSGSVNGVAWLKRQVEKGNLGELSTTPTPVAGGPIDAYGVSVGNVGIDDVGKYHSRKWSPSEIEFSSASPGPNVLCLHDGVTPYRNPSTADVDLDKLLARSRVSFDCVLVGDEHRPRGGDFEAGYSFKTSDGTPVLYTGPAARIGYAYRDRRAFVTELTFSDGQVTTTRHEV
ncbi:DNA repair exonuclease [Haloferax alexandrinus]|uniref:DNA repair exonuclease n=1 Tax=Haloferax volcanii TaxID=2246 RepID=A0A847TJ34_HALVO|nr:DNA repair exonuclease [Haloferax alexandrinus]